MAKFRSPELVKRYEYNYYDLQTPLNSDVGNNQRQKKIITALSLIIFQKQIPLIGTTLTLKLILNLLNMLMEQKLQQEQIMEIKMEQQPTVIHL